MKPCGAVTAGMLIVFVGATSGCLDQPLELQGTEYMEDFEDGAGPEWTARMTSTTPSGDRKYLGDFGNRSVTLTLVELAPHDEVRVAFDLYLVRSWDGNSDGVEGPDIWQLKAMDSQTLLRTTFDNHPPGGDDDHRQSFPDDYPADNPAGTGATEVGTLGYQWLIGDVDERPSDSVYHLVFDLEHGDETLVLEFSAEGLHGGPNESWGIDNVEITLN